MLREYLQLFAAFIHSEDEVFGSKPQTIRVQTMPPLVATAVFLIYEIAAMSLYGCF